MNAKLQLGSFKRRRVSILVGFATLVAGVAIAAPANAIIVGVCTIKANNPHGSTHVSGTINAVGTVSCTLVQDEIYIRTYLEKSTGASWGGNTQDYFDSSWEQSNAATSCNQGPGTFRTRVSYAIHAPVGVSPRYAANTIYSPWVPVACGVSNRATSSGNGAAETLETVTFQTLPIPGDASPRRD